MLVVGIGVISILGSIILSKQRTLLKQIKPDSQNLFRFAFRLKTNPKLLDNHIKAQNQRIQISRDQLIKNIQSALDSDFVPTKLQSKMLYELKNKFILISIKNSQIGLVQEDSIDATTLIERNTNPALNFTSSLVDDLQPKKENIKSKPCSPFTEILHDKSEMKGKHSIQKFKINKLFQQENENRMSQSQGKSQIQEEQIEERDKVEEEQDL